MEYETQNVSEEKELRVLNETRKILGMRPIQIRRIPCIKCKTYFRSMGPQNRMCYKCKSTKCDDQVGWEQ